MTPEEYAARHAHQWLCFSFDDYRYTDPALQQWIHRLGDIFFQRESTPTIEELRARHLNDDERRKIEQEIAEMAE